MLLEPIYEQDFCDGSYGFRPQRPCLPAGRSAHDALEALRQETTRVGGGWILEVDLRPRELTYVDIDTFEATF